jgi:hypothetical protein
MVDKETYIAIYGQAMQELSELLEERERLEIKCDEIDTRLAEIRKGVVALAPLCGRFPWAEHPEWFPDIDVLRDIGLTDAIREVLQRAGQVYLSPVGIRDGLKDVGYEIKSKNILPSIHNTVKRLIDAVEVETENREGRTWYRLKAIPPPLRRSPYAPPGKPWPTKKD